MASRNVAVPVGSLRREPAALILHVGGVVLAEVDEAATRLGLHLGDAA